jgi:hypothetical protein
MKATSWCPVLCVPLGRRVAKSLKQQFLSAEDSGEDNEVDAEEEESAETNQEEHGACAQVKSSQDWAEWKRQYNGIRLLTICRLENFRFCGF